MIYLTNYKVRVFLKIDLRSGWHQLRIKLEDILKMAFRISYGHHKFTMMLFELTNTPVAFMDIMKWVFRSYFANFVVVFIYDTLIYSKIEEEHTKHLRIILETLRKHRLYATNFAYQKLLFWDTSSLLKELKWTRKK